MLSRTSLAASTLMACALAGCSSAQTFDHPADGGPSDAARDGTTHGDSSAPDAGDGGTPTDGAADVAPDVTGDAQAPIGDGGPSLCDGSGFLFCDGFEQGLANWNQTYYSGGPPTVDSAHVYRGASALHAHVDAVTAAGTTAYTYAQQVQTWPAHVFARAFVYQPSPSPPNPAALLDMLYNGSPYPGIEVLTSAPSGGLSMKTYSTGQDQAWASDAGAAPLDQWVCLELEVDTTLNTSHLYLNDVEVTDLAGVNLHLSQLGVLGVGLSFLTPGVQDAQDAWIDEVAVNGSRIGCAN